ncbi:hypothetical protein [Planomonospora venezuelensis]|uniref:Outer membrane murein-binding lipoprotein Lpp n=1 Tax=Planomonospora venezuelensis TaxID=1999 RepID=A0A841D0T4_PLAVE|nr:hypothetical protein [Planomonospora venezuelensis]MBB5961156.1 outer membrane murein-binding lipoprotein Lpp [Planomonospora venezuelensis]GIM99826.1 hypothetical protein Pve01_14850 [Planomonospora venezuelensis]
MGVSRQATFTLACVALLSVLVPGCAGYLSARMEALDQAHLRLSALEERLREANTTQARMTVAAVPIPCETPSRPRPAPPPAEVVPATAGAREQEARAEEREHRRRVREERTELISSVREAIRGTIAREHGTGPGQAGPPSGRPLAETSGGFRSSRIPLG